MCNINLAVKILSDMFLLGARSIIEVLFINILN